MRLSPRGQQAGATSSREALAVHLEALLRVDGALLPLSAWFGAMTHKEK